MSILVARNLEKHFGGLAAVSDLSFELNQGEILSLIGPNGAGKTTVFNCLCGALPLDAGEVILQGRSIRGLEPFEVCRRGMVRTFQVVRPFLNVSVLDNVLIGAMARHGRFAAANKEALRVIEFLGLGKYTKAHAHSLPLPLRKRLEMARALATGPGILLLDEVMAGLNPTEVDELIGLIREINHRGTTILMIEHVMRGVMALSERVIVLNYGAKIAEGTPQEVVAHDGVIEAYLGKEFAHAHGNRS